MEMAEDGRMMKVFVEGEKYVVESGSHLGYATFLSMGTGTGMWSVEPVTKGLWDMPAAIVSPRVGNVIGILNETWTPIGKLDRSIMVPFTQYWPYMGIGDSEETLEGKYIALLGWQVELSSRINQLTKVENKDNTKKVMEGHGFKWMWDMWVKNKAKNVPWVVKTFNEWGSYTAKEFDKNSAKVLMETTDKIPTVHVEEILLANALAAYQQFCEAWAGTVEIKVFMTAFEIALETVQNARTAEQEALVKEFFDNIDPLTRSPRLQDVIKTAPLPAYFLRKIGEEWVFATENEADTSMSGAELESVLCTVQGGRKHQENWSLEIST